MQDDDDEQREYAAVRSLTHLAADVGTSMFFGTPLCGWGNGADFGQLRTTKESVTCMVCVLALGARFRTGLVTARYMYP